ncbi:MAG: L,D-transpeptidase [Pseudomonadota bacterium]
MLLVAVVSFGFVTTNDSLANNRYAEAPPVLLSPDLTEPWQLQMTANRKPRLVLRSSKSRAFLRKKKRDGRYQTAAISEQERRRTMDPKFLPQIVEYTTTHTPGTIVIDTNTKFLYLVLGNGEARRYGVGVGKPGFEWVGSHRVTRKAEWPDWRPPAQMIARERAKGRILPTFMAGGPKNPMGARALYLGSTLYRIHGTNAPWTIGQAVSSGCFRMRNQDVTDLYNRVPVGARVVVI